LPKWDFGYQGERATVKAPERPFKVCGTEITHLLHIYLAGSTRKLPVALQQNSFTLLDRIVV